jgi:ubiquinone/menaquinone biosynthesis C-methylase UbiE
VSGPTDKPADRPALNVDAIHLYDVMSAGYDDSFEIAGYRRAYDLLAGEYISAYLPASRGVIIDAGCGTGRWASKWLKQGHRVIGIEQSPQMMKLLRQRKLGRQFTLIAGPMETVRIKLASADLVVAMGSFQYSSDPPKVLQRFASWVKPGGFVCVYTDSLVALVLELIRVGKIDECMQRLIEERGVLSVGNASASLRLYHSAALKADLEQAGLINIDCRGLLTSSSACGREQWAAAMNADEAAFLNLERRLSRFPLLADVGRHIIASGQRPA